MQGFSGYDMYSHHDDAEGDSSADSEDYNKMINFYQNEIKTKNTYTGQKLPKGVSIIIGHANESFLRKDFDDAIELCHEAIRIFPENSEPYHLMSIIYGEKQDMKKSVDFLFISTQLNNQSDKESWWRIADKYYNLKCYKNASYCYGRALKCEKLNVSLLRKKAECYDKLKDWRGAIKYYEKV
jgi:tetratricopeptide (TPR) repeat protein